MKNKEKEIKKIALAALFVAISCFLKFNSIFIADPGFRISIFPISLLIAGYFLGPVYGLMVGFATDTVFMFYYGSIWNFYTVSAMLWGLAGSFIRRFEGNKSVVTFIIVITLTSLLETGVNSIQILIEKNLIDLLAGLPWRLLTLAVRLPFLIFITKYLVNRLNLLEIKELYNQ